MKVTNYRELIAWQKSVDLVVAVYQATKVFPPDEIYGLTSQVRRAAVSVPSNISEGQGRGTPNEFIRGLRLAHGSLQESETQLVIAQRLAYLAAREAEGLLDQTAEVGRIINGLIKSIR
ncbi:MAG: four helix bundle protein [Verrucomicrobia bacterium]|nr:four helix bundle protein [Verrucomicrobiota bacterium]